MSEAIKIAAAHPPGWRDISCKIEDEAKVLALVDGHIKRIQDLADEAADAGALVVAFPEDTLGLLGWQSAHLESQMDLITTANDRLLEAVSAKAQERSIYIIVCNDMLAADAVVNAAVLIGRDGKEIGPYQKVNQPFAERWKTQGATYPVYETDDLGTVGLSICYDLVFPEATRALALSGADIVFNLSMGGASMSSRPGVNSAALITRAADNFLPLVFVKRGQSKFISPEGEILSATENDEPITYGEFDLSRREGSEAPDLGDLRARVFAERMPETYGILSDPNPPVLQKLKTDRLPPEEVYWRAWAKAITTGNERLEEADKLLAEGKAEEAQKRFEDLMEEFKTSWVALASKRRLEAMTAED